MIISRTPLRLSFTGGGSDLPVYYRRFGGAVISTSIDRYVYVTVNKKFDDKIRLSYSKTEEVDHVGMIEHRLVRACLQKLGISGGLEITSIADIPSRGTGLGSSSSFTVGLLHSLHAYRGEYVSSEYLAAEACEIEIDICGEPIGRQDQYAAASGGLNYIRFNPDDTVDVFPIICKPDAVLQLERNLLTFYTGMTRGASEILSQQGKALEDDESKCRTIGLMVEYTRVLKDELQKNKVDVVGEILHESWLLKQSITNGISNDKINEWYERGRQAGAIGGKILGAGGGGFLVFYAPESLHPRIIHSLPELRAVKFGFEKQGSKIIFYH
jgi:D-glycero-alpha-D-manno-heptose-7-phosphate kinase